MASADTEVMFSSFQRQKSVEKDIGTLLDRCRMKGITTKEILNAKNVVFSRKQTKQTVEFRCTEMVVLKFVLLPLVFMLISLLIANTDINRPFRAYVRMAFIKVHFIRHIQFYLVT